MFCLFGHSFMTILSLSAEDKLKKEDVKHEVSDCRCWKITFRVSSLKCNFLGGMLDWDYKKFKVFAEFMKLFIQIAKKC